MIKIFLIDELKFIRYAIKKRANILIAIEKIFLWNGYTPYSGMAKTSMRYK